MHADYELRPAAGISFATFEHDIGSAFKKAVLLRAAASRWNCCSSVDAAARADQFVEATGLRDVPGVRTLHRGSEAALRALVARHEPGRLFAPSSSYPGFARVARAAGVPLLRYDGTTELGDRLDERDLVVVVDPPSVCSAGDPRTIALQVARSSAMLVVDATFMLFDPLGLERLRGLLDGIPACVLVGASKSAGLDGVRVGVAMDPFCGRAQVTDATEWDVLQCAVVDVLLADGELTERAAFVARCQRATLPTLEDLVARAGARAVCSENPFALTVPVVPKLQALSGLTGVKLYPELQAMRLDVSRTMVERVRNVTRT